MLFVSAKVSQFAHPVLSENAITRAHSPAPGVTLRDPCFDEPGWAYPAFNSAVITVRTTCTIRSRSWGMLSSSITNETL